MRKLPFTPSKRTILLGITVAYWLACTRLCLNSGTAKKLLAKTQIAYELYTVRLEDIMIKIREIKSDDFLNTMLQSMDLPIACWSAQSDLLYISDSLLRLFACTNAEEFCQKIETFSPENQPDGKNSYESRKKHFKTAFEKGSHYFVWTHLLPDGSEKIVEYHLRRTEYQGEPVIIVHITEAKSILASLEEKHAADKRAKAMVDATPMGISFWNKDLQIQDCNLGILQLVKAPSKEDYIQNNSKYRPELQPDGRKSDDVAREALSKAFEVGNYQLAWTQKDSQGQHIPVQITLKRERYGDEDVVVEFAHDLRELKASQKATMAATERMQIMLNTMPLGANLWNTNLENIASNLAAAKLFDLADAKEYLDNFFKLSPEVQPDGSNSAEAAYARVREAFETGYAKFEWLHQKLNGEPIPTEVTLIRKKYQGEDVVLGYTQDLRELKATQALAESAEERSKVILNTMPISVNFWNKNFELIDCNMESVSLFAAQNEAEVISRFQELSPELQPDGTKSSHGIKRVISEAFEKGYTRFEWLHSDLKGNALPVEVTLIRSSFRGEDIVVAYLRDLRELKASQEAAQEAIERNQVMLDTMPLCANFWSKDMKNLACNAEAPRLFGLKDQKEYLERFFELSPEYQPCGELSAKLAVEKVNEAFAEGKSVFEWMHRKPDDTPMPCEITLIRSSVRGEDFVVGYTRDMREIKASQEATREAIDRNETMLDTMPLCANFWSKDMENLACNAAAPRLFDLKDKQEYLDRFFELSPEYQPNGELSSKLAAENIQTAFKEGQCIFEWMHQKLDGTPMPCEISLIRTSMRGDDAVVGFTRDMREIKASQEAAQEAIERNQIMLDTMPLCANFWSKDMENLACNAEAPRLFGLKDRQEYLDKFFQLSPEFQPDGQYSSVKAGQNIIKAFEEGYCKFEWLHQNLEGEPIPAEITLIRRAIRGEDFVIGYTRDLREIKASQDMAQEAEHRTQLMLDSFPMGANFWNASLQLVDCNMEVAKLYGFESKERYRENFATVLPEFQPNGEPSAQVVGAKLQQALETGFERFEFMCIMPKTGEPLPVEVTIVRIVHHGEYGAVSYVRDLREFKTMLEEIHAAEEDLRKAKDVAEQSAKAKSEFLANMSHEIRTPMNGILGLLHLLSSTELQSDQKSYVSKTLYSANNLLRIINDILDFSKIEAGKLEIEATPFNMSQICKEVQDLYSVPIKEKGLALKLTGCELDVEYILGDPLRLKQILFNLVSNAIKFTQRGGVELSVKIQERYEDSIICLFGVTDTGIGLSQSQMDRLFSAFSQADSSVTRKYGGTGLGLAISRNLAQMMQGDMWVESVEGQGTTFYFTAKFGLCADNFTPQEHTAEIEAGPVQGVGNLLLVEDNEINQLIAEEMLRSVGYTVETANNGQEALDMLQVKSYDLVLMDIQMPIMDGLTTSRNIRKMPQFDKLPIVAMSAHAMAGDKEISIANGMDDHITKPIVPETLYSTLQYWLNVGRNTKDA